MYFKRHQAALDSSFVISALPAFVDGHQSHHTTNFSSLFCVPVLVGQWLKAARFCSIK